MAQRSAVESPSPESQTEVFSYRSSRAGSEAPQRPHASLARSPRSYRSSRAGSEAPQRARDGHSLRSSPGATPRLSDGRIEYDETRGVGIGGGAATAAATAGTVIGATGYSYNNKHGKKRGGGGVNKKYEMAAGNGSVERVAFSGRTQRRHVHGNEANEMEEALYHSVPHAGGEFKLLQKLCYPFDPCGSMLKCQIKNDSIDINDESAEYEATGELNAANGVDTCATRSVVRQEIEAIESSVSAMAMCMMPDPVHGSPVLSLCVGDANGRVNYCELAVGNTKRLQSPNYNSRKSRSNLSIASHSQTEEECNSFSNSFISEGSFLSSDIKGFQRPPVRKHSHQAYVREMDCLTSVTILQSIKTLRFLQSHESPSTVSYLTSNERVIKLFRVHRDGFSPFHAFPLMESIVGRRLAYSPYFPHVVPSQLILPVRVFSGSHTSPVQDLSVCVDGRSFLSVDDLQVFWWDLEGTDTSKGTCITDCRPNSGRMDEVDELVTSAAFHPTHSSIFLVSRSSGLLGIGDLRDSLSGSQRHYSNIIRVTEDPQICFQEQYNDILCSISRADFLGPNHIVTRDYLSLKLWDLRRSDIPYSVSPVMSYIAPYLDSLYENNSIFDRFPLVVDHISGTVVTGLYDGAAAVWQPLQEGRLPPEEITAHYRADPLALPCEVENDGRISAEELGANISQALDTPSAAEPAGEVNSEELPEPVANKVISVAVADGGERFALTCKEGRCIFLFERKTVNDSPNSMGW